MRCGLGTAGLAAGALVLAAAGCTTPQHSRPAASGHRDATASNRALPFPDPVTGPLPGRERAALQAVLADIVDPVVRAGPDGAPGVTAAVVGDRGSWQGAAGVDGFGRRLRPDAMMSIASITKTFVAAEVMRLAQARQLALDAPVTDYLPGSPTRRGATVRQVLGMRSGLRDPPDAVWQAKIAHRATIGGRHWSLGRTLTYLHPTAHLPGGAPVYANVSYLLLGQLIEKVTGSPLPRVERSDLFARAGLVRIATQDTERPTAPVALAPRSVNPHPDGYLPDRAWAGAGADSFGGLAADAPTVATWGYQLYGARLLAPRSVTAMETPRSVENISPGIEYGLGTMAFEGLSPDPTYGHIGQYPGYLSILAVDGPRHLSASLLVVDAKPFDAVGAMRDLLATLT